MQVKKEDKLGENFLDKINEGLEYKLDIQDIEKVLDITDSFSDEFKSKIVEGRDIKNKKVYCVILKDSIEDRKTIECLRALIVTDNAYFLFYSKNMKMY